MVYKSGYLSTGLSQFTRVTDRRTEFSSLDRACIQCSTVKIWTYFSSVLSQSTFLTDRQTDAFLTTRPPCIQCSAVKTSSRPDATCRQKLRLQRNSPLQSGSGLVERVQRDVCRSVFSVQTFLVAPESHQLASRKYSLESSTMQYKQGHTVMDITCSLI